MTTRLFIQLSQPDGRMFVGEKYPYERVANSMLLCVFRLDAKESRLQQFSMERVVGTSGMYNLYREVNTGFFDVENGCYAVIPSTRQAGKEGDFTISVYFDCADESEVRVQQPGNAEFHPSLIPDLERNKLTPEQVAATREIKQVIKSSALAAIISDSD